MQLVISHACLSGRILEHYTEHLAKCIGAIPHYDAKITLFRTVWFFPHFSWLFAEKSHKPQNKRLKTVIKSMDFVFGRWFNLLNNRYLPCHLPKSRERAKNKSGVVSEMRVSLISTNIARLQCSIVLFQNIKKIMCSPQCYSVFLTRTNAIQLFASILQLY